MSNHEDVLFRYYLQHSFVCLLEKSLATAEEVNKLLRKILAAHRPESSSFTSSEYYCIFHVLYFSLELKVECLGIRV